VRRVLRVGRHGRVQDVAGLPVGRGWEDLDTRVALIQALIPLGLGAVEEELQREVERLAGPRYARKDGAPDRVRWGRQRGSVYLLDHKVPVQVPRVRDQAAGGGGPSGELSEAATAAGSGRGDAAAGPVGLSCRDYRAAAEAVPEAFGLPHFSVSRRYLRATARKLEALQERRLEGYDFVAQVERRVWRVSRGTSSDQKRRSVSRGASGRGTQAATPTRVSGSPAATSCLAESDKAGV